jgi:hypothetical protein
VQLIAPPRVARPPLGAALIGIAVGLVLLVGGIFLAWLTFTTPVVSRLAPTTIRAGLPQIALGGVVWGIALVAPASFAIVGAWRLSRVVGALTARPADRALTLAAQALGDDYHAASDVRLPEGRTIPNLVVGPFGLAVVAELPPPRFVRRTGTSWEFRRHDGRWAHMENPLERTARDAERVRRWHGATERDYVVRVYAAVVSTDPDLERTGGCAVVTPEQVSAWLASLPPARSLSADRRAEIVEQVRGLI